MFSFACLALPLCIRFPDGKIAIELCSIRNVNIEICSLLGPGSSDEPPPNYLAKCAMAIAIFQRD